MLVGSTRQNSINQKLARAIQRSAPENLEFVWVGMDEMPFYNSDLEPDRPLAVNDFTKSIKSTDAACIVTPEYNRSIPAVLKNAIDWGSKPADENVWRDLPVAMTGTSPGAVGTAVAQQHLRQILSILGAHVMPGEAYISFKSSDMIDGEGNVSDGSVEKFIAAFAARFAAYIKMAKL